MAFDRTKPADTDYISASAANLRENFRALAEDTRLYGTGAPESSAGQNGWRYVDTATGDEYLKVNNAWIKKTDLAALIRDLFVGAVSENEGVPTGAIIESGSNANGTYVKFADGTMICTGLTTFNSVSSVEFLSLFYVTLNKDFPATFTNIPIVTCEPGFRESYIFWSAVCAPSTTGFAMYTLSQKAFSSIDVNVSFLAIGRWF